MQIRLSRTHRANYFFKKYTLRDLHLARFHTFCLAYFEFEGTTEGFTDWYTNSGMAYLPLAELYISIRISGVRIGGTYWIKISFL
jgi:hypothetical protein